MPKPIKRRDFIRRLRTFGWAGPESGGSHEVMRQADGRRLAIPNPHRGDLDWCLVKRILQQGGITPEEWESAD